MHPGFLHYSPIAPSRGGNGLAMRTSMFSEGLARIGHVDVVVVGSPADGEDWQPGNVAVHHIATEGRLDTRLRLISQIPDIASRAAALRAYGRPLATASLSAPVLAEACAMLASDNCAAVLLSRAHLLPLVDGLKSRSPSTPVIVDLDDDDASLLREWAALKLASGDRQGAAWLEAQADVTDDLILASNGKVAAFTCASEAVARSLASRLALAKVSVVPNGIDITRIETSDRRARTMIFVGNLSYEPNIDGVVWFCTKVFPLLRERMRDARLIVAGSRPVQAVSDACTGEGITLHPDVRDISALYSQASVALVPLRSGSGSRIKILEAAVHGLPVVSTSKGAQGLAPGIEAALFIAREDPVEFSKALMTCLDDRNAAGARAARLQSLVTMHHDRAAIIARIEDMVRRLL